MIWLSLASRTAAQDNAQLEIGGGKIDVAFSSAPAEAVAQTRPRMGRFVGASGYRLLRTISRFPICNSKSDFSKEAVCAEAERPVGTVR